MLQQQGAARRRRRARRAERRSARRRARARKEQRTKPAPVRQEVRAELRKVAWPTRAETINYSIIVFVAVVVLTAFDRRARLRSSARLVLWIFDA